MTQEGHLASVSMLAGFEALSKLNYEKPGTVYLTLFQLSTGLERIMKIAFILNYMSNNDLKYPCKKDLKFFGHNISDLYEKLRETAKKRSMTNGWFKDQSIHAEAIAALSEFAVSTRYYNTDQLVGHQIASNPLIRWFEVHLKIAEAAISQTRLDGIKDRAVAFCEERALLGYEMGPMGRLELTIDVNYQLEVARVSRGQFVWAIIETLKPIYSLLDQLVVDVHNLEKTKNIDVHTVPYMTEFFPFCLTDKRTAVRRKQWKSLFSIGGRV
jgi:hypothetical protein